MTFTFSSFGKESQHNATWAHLPWVWFVFDGVDGVDGVVLPPVLLIPDCFDETNACAPVNVFLSAFIWVCICLVTDFAMLGFTFCVFPPVVFAAPSDLLFPS